MRANYTRPTKDQVTWRRLKTQELMIKGNSPLEICSVLKVSQQVVHRDIRILREEARKNIQTHLEDRLPHEYENCMAGINQVLKMSWEIAGGLNINDNDNTSGKTTTIEDNRTKLHALALANDCYKYKMDLVTNGVVITEAIKFVQQKQEELNLRL